MAAKKPKAGKKPAGKKAAAKPKVKAKAGGTKPVVLAEPKDTAPNKVARKVIAAERLKKLVRLCAGLLDESRTINGTIREKIDNAVEHEHLNKEVFALIRKLDKKEPAALYWFLEDFEHYLDASGLSDKADEVLDLIKSGKGNPPKVDFNKATRAKAATKAAGVKANGKNGHQDADAEIAADKAQDGEASEAGDGIPLSGKAPGGEFVMLPDSKPH